MDKLEDTYGSNSDFIFYHILTQIEYGFDSSRIIKDSNSHSDVYCNF